MSSSISNLNPDTIILDTTTNEEKLTSISKFGLLLSIAQHINTSLIFHYVHINDSRSALDIELYSWVFIYLKIYQFSQTLMIHKMLKVFHNEFHGWGYIKFRKMDWHIKNAFMEMFIAKKIYIDIANIHINQRLAKFITNEQLLFWDQTKLLIYKSMYLTSKV